MPSTGPKTPRAPRPRDPNDFPSKTVDLSKHKAMEEDTFRRWVAAHELPADAGQVKYKSGLYWTFARSMQFMPHEYVHYTAVEGGLAGFAEACAFVATAGQPARWPFVARRTLRMYLPFEGWLYWQIGGALNRCRIDEKGEPRAKANRVLWIDPDELARWAEEQRADRLV